MTGKRRRGDENALASGEEHRETREQTRSIGAVFWTLRRLQRELSENSNEEAREKPDAAEEEAAATAVDALLTQFCHDTVPASQRAAVGSELSALRKRFQTVPVAGRFLVALREKKAGQR